MSTKRRPAKFIIALAAAVTLAISSGAHALNYTGKQGNQATFETLEEARESGPKAVATLEGNAGRTFKSHPVLDNYPKGTTYIYRSPNLYGGRAAARLNANILVFAERSFASKDEAQKYLNDLGLIKIMDEAIGSIILVTPANGTAFGQADQKNYYALQTAIFAQKAGEGGGGGGGGGRGGPGGAGRGPGGPGGAPGGPAAPGGPGRGAPGAGGPPAGPAAAGAPAAPPAGPGPAARGGAPGGPGGAGPARGPGGGGGGGGGASFSDAEYFGGFGYTYVIGIDGGATFLNNYVAGTTDYVSRIAGMLLINGKMDAARNVAALVPAYLVNAPQDVIEKYKKANDTSAYAKVGNVESFYDQTLPLKRVTVTTDASPNVASYIKDAYYNMFIKAMRVPVTKAGMHSAGTPYQGYSMDQAPLSLCERNAVLNGKTMDGIHVITKQNDTFSDLKMQNGEYLQLWFEYLPEEVVNGTAPAGTIPLILANHGGGDDPRQFVEEIGLLPLAGSQRFAMVAPDHSTIANLLPEALPKLVKHMLKTYPSLDPSRVYVTGYSMGGAATLRAINGDPSVFAASVPMSAAPYTGTPEQVAQFAKAHLPVMFTTSTYDLGGAFDQNNVNIATGYQTQLNLFLGYNAMKKIDAYDFKTYPIVGFKADSMNRTRVNGEYDNYQWYINNEAGVPMVAVNYTTNLNHALYPEYGKIAWDFFKKYSRDQKTGQIKYNPYAK